MSPAVAIPRRTWADALAETCRQAVVIGLGLLGLAALFGAVFAIAVLAWSL
jgi:Zn-dependent alcohol dehydrogenase